MRKLIESREALREVLGIGRNGGAENWPDGERPSTVSICPSQDGRSVLDDLVRQGARQMLQAALEAEVDEFLQRHDPLRDSRTRRQVIRNGYLPERTILTGAGPLKVQQPRVRDLGKHDGEAIQFRSAILPPYRRHGGRAEGVGGGAGWLPRERGQLDGVAPGTQEPRPGRSAAAGHRSRRAGIGILVRGASGVPHAARAIPARRDWVHKTANVLDKLPKSVQPRAKEDLHEIWMAETREAAHQAFDRFVAKYEAKYPKAVECLKKDRAELLAFYDFPAEHWSHLRTTNPIESTFATVRLRHDRTKGNGTRQACLTMVFKLIESAAKHWRRLNGFERIVPLLQGKKFVNGKLQDAA